MPTLGRPEPTASRMLPFPTTDPTPGRAPEDLATVAAHDLREPLETVAGFLALLERRHAAALDEEGRDLLRHAVEGTQRMRDVLAGLLRAAREDAAAPAAEVDLGVVAREVVELLGAQVQRTGGRIELGDLPRLPGDPVALRRALQNLVSNALGATDGRPPVVEVAARRAPGPGGADGWAVDVRDHGPGIPAAERERIFAAFARLEPTAAPDGVGLGLALTRAIAEAHGGTVAAADAPGGGARFTLWLPA